MLDAGHQVDVVDDLSRNDDRQIPADATFHQLRVQDVAQVTAASSERPATVWPQRSTATPIQPHGHGQCRQSNWRRW
ncbi:hypothetical protein ACFU44_16055 [Nocardia rhizosphaerihabitans]|uniref:hypothetical protein n=1 Tax=Nocardia rhizosphaerihabitans TaxID=1691570 RepID=UPI00366ED553